MTAMDWLANDLYSSTRRRSPCGKQGFFSPRIVYTKGMDKDIRRPVCVARYKELLKKYQKELVKNKITEDLNKHLSDELYLWKTGQKTLQK